jgi:hypothetical protein
MCVCFPTAHETANRALAEQHLSLLAERSAAFSQITVLEKQLARMGDDSSPEPASWTSDMSLSALRFGQPTALRPLARVAAARSSGCL